MNLRTSMLKMTAVFAVVFSFVACEDDFETVGSNVIGEPGFNADLYEDAEISAVTNDLAPVQTNGLPLNLLGVYKDPLYGTQEASILTQVYLANTNPDFGNSPKLDSVVLSIPYFSSEVEAEEGEEATYKLDSVYGKGAIKLTVLKSNFFLNNFDPDTDFQTNKKYFSNLEPEILANASPEILFYDDDFRPSSSTVTEYPLEEDGEVADTLVLKPRMRLHLDAAFFQSQILDMQGSSELSSQNNFRNYFRGLYLLAEQTGGESVMMLLNLVQADAGITLYYTAQVADTEDRDDDGNTTENVEAHRSFRINFGPTRVNTFDQEVDILDETNLYLKGGEGSMAIIDLFSGPDADDNGASDELEFLRDSEWLINDAILEFSVNHEMTAGSNEPELIYLYNLKTHEPVIDYYQLDPLGNIIVSRDGIRQVSASHVRKIKSPEDENQIIYRIRITEHIDRLLNSDAENVKLGLVVSQNGNLTTSSAVLQRGATNVERVPTTSVISPEGTVLFGPNAEDAALRPVLKIYYTEPKE